MRTLNTAVFGILGLVLSCGPEGVPASDGTPTRVHVTVLGTEPVGREIPGYGALTYRKKVEITAPSGGTVGYLPWSGGEKVRKGDPLVRLVNPQLEIRLAQAEASLGAAQASLAMAEAVLWESRIQVRSRWASLEKHRIEAAQKRKETEDAARNLETKRKLYEAGGVAQETWISWEQEMAAREAALAALEKESEARQVGFRDQDLAELGRPIPGEPEARLDLLVILNTRTAEAGVASARAQVESAGTEVDSARRLLDDLEIRSPLDGMIGAKAAEEGESVAPGAPLVSVVDPTALEAVVPVPAAEARDLAEGTEADVTADGVPGRTVRSRVSWVSPLVDPQSGALLVKVPVANAGGHYKPGMFARVVVKTGKPVVTVVLPRSAVVRRQGDQAQVFLAAGNHAVVRKVSLGRDLGGRFEVKEGLEAGNLVIADPSALLQDGERIDVE